MPAYISQKLSTPQSFQVAFGRTIHSDRIPKKIDHPAVPAKVTAFRPRVASEHSTVTVESSRTISSVGGSQRQPASSKVASIPKRVPISSVPSRLDFGTKKSPVTLDETIADRLQTHRPELAGAVKSGDKSKTLRLLSQESERARTVLRGPFGINPTVYTDLNAYGLPLTVARKISRELERVVGNTHGDSALARVSTRYLNEAVSGILGHFGAVAYRSGAAGASGDPQRSYDVLVRGSGFTAAQDGYLDYLNRHISTTILTPGQSLRDGAFGYSVYEHHSNSLPAQDWTPAPTQIGLKEDGSLDFAAVEHFLNEAVERAAPFIVLTLSLQSNVTSVKTDLGELQRYVQQFLRIHSDYRDRLFLSADLAAYAPHATLNLSQLHRDAAGTPLFDAIAFSPYKLDGGQQGAGIALVRAHVTGDTPIVKGGGTVAFVYKATQDGTLYATSDRYDLHNAGSPNVMAVVNTYLGLKVQDWVGTDSIQARERQLTATAYKALQGFAHDGVRLKILGPEDLSLRGNTFPFVIEIEHGGTWLQVPPAFIGLALEQFTGVTTRSGCNCAGPYGIALLKYDERSARALATYLTEANIDKVRGLLKPGWTRASMSALMTDAEHQYFIWAWKWLVQHLRQVMSVYRFDGDTGRFEVDQKRQKQIHTAIDLRGGKWFEGGKIGVFKQLDTARLLHVRQAAVVRASQSWLPIKTSAIEELLRQAHQTFGESCAE